MFSCICMSFCRLQSLVEICTWDNISGDVIYLLSSCCGGMKFIFSIDS